MAKNLKKKKKITFIYRIINPYEIKDIIQLYNFKKIYICLTINLSKINNMAINLKKII